MSTNDNIEDVRKTLIGELESFRNAVDKIPIKEDGELDLNAFSKILFDHRRNLLQVTAQLTDMCAKSKK